MIVGGGGGGVEPWRLLAGSRPAASSLHPCQTGGGGAGGGDGGRLLPLPATSFGRPPRDDRRLLPCPGSWQIDGDDDGWHQWTRKPRLYLPKGALLAPLLGASRRLAISGPQMKVQLNLSDDCLAFGPELIRQAH